jgi:hypothetical protein
VQKVVQLLAELKVKVQQDLEAEGKAMKEYSEFCDDSQSEKEYAIKTAAADIERFDAVVEESVSQIEARATEIAGAGSEIASKQKELAGAKKVRDDEHSDFVAAQKELVEAVDMLSRAAVVLKRGLSLVQGKNKMDDIVRALTAVVNASWVDASSAAKVRAFLESEDDLSLKQPQAIVRNYESKSGGIVETLEDMKDKASDNLQKMRREEANARHAFEMLQQSLQDAVSNLEKEVQEATSSKAETGQVKGQAEGDLARTQEVKAADEKYLAKLRAECTNKAAEWESRQKSAVEEVAALEQARQILAGGVTALVQTSQRSVETEAQEAARDKVVLVLRKLGRKFSSFGLMQIANSASADPFVKVRAMVETMISKLEEQAAEEASHEWFCKSETKKSLKARETKTHYVEKYQTRVDAGNAASAMLKQEIATLEAEVTAIDKQTSEATKQRSEEKVDNAKAAKDYKESAEAVTQAIQVLRDFYGEQTGSVSLIQAGPEFGQGSADAAHGIVAILETAQSDFSRLLAETESSESTAVETFETLVQENRVSKAKKQASIKGKTSEKKSIELGVVNHNQDLDTASKELDAVMDYLAKLRPQCENKAMTYEERKARREAEIAGLKEALTILAGEAVLLQKNTAFLARK